MSAERSLPNEAKNEQEAQVLPFLPAAAATAIAAQGVYAKLDFESWLSLCNVSTWLDLAESQSNINEQRRSA